MEVSFYFLIFAELKNQRVISVMVRIDNMLFSLVGFNDMFSLLKEYKGREEEIDRLDREFSLLRKETEIKIN